MLMKWLDKFFGRYFLVWVAGTVLMYQKVISETNWFYLTIGYLTGGILSKGMAVWESRKK